ncbi:MAG: PQQ-binding-like beta-propeller repeat protein [Lentisphaeria bacterium]|nr:PQQ-binding-like beta-propeller repeat protein [Lentisphaeria bacterium]
MSMPSRGSATLGSVRVRQVVLCLLALSVPAFRAADWPQWRGPYLNGSADDLPLPAEWTDTRNVRWSVPLPGPGSATPIVWGQRVFLSSVRREDDALVALCLDTRTGTTLWSREVARNRDTANNTMASPSAVTDGTHVCFTFGMVRMSACTVAGEPVWERDLEKEHGYSALMFGYSSSPLLHEGVLFLPVIRNANPGQYAKAVPPGVDGSRPVRSYVIAVDLADGRTLWRQERVAAAVGESQEAYTTPALLRRNGRTEILVYGADKLTAHDATDGRETWSWEGYNPTRINHWRVVTTPLVGRDLVYVVGPKHQPLYAIRPPDGEGTRGETVWEHPKLTPDASTPLLYRDRLYLLHDNRRLLACLDPATGKELWQIELGGRGVIRASMTGVDGRLYILYENGEAVVVDSAEPGRILHRFPMGGHPARSTIAVGDHALFVRTAERLVCIGP